MSTKFFTNRAHNTLLKKFEGVFEHNKDIEFFDALVGYFRASGYFAIRPHLDDVPNIRVLVGINVDKVSSDFHKKGLLFLADSNRTISEFRKETIKDIQSASYDRDTCPDVIEILHSAIQLAQLDHRFEFLGNGTLPAIAKQAWSWTIQHTMQFSHLGSGINDISKTNVGLHVDAGSSQIATEADVDPLIICVFCDSFASNGVSVKRQPVGGDINGENIPDLGNDIFILVAGSPQHVYVHRRPELWRIPGA